jgi:hypothetical protein
MSDEFCWDDGYTSGGWDGDTDDLAEYNRNEALDYMHELDEQLALGEVCWNCGALYLGVACPDGCDSIPKDVRAAQPVGYDNWIARLRAETEGGWGE